MAPLPPRDQRHLWLCYQVKGYTEEIVHDFEQRLEMIFGRQVNRVHILDFEGLTPDMRQDLAERLRMVYTGDDGHELFVSHAWRRLFEIRAPLVQEFILKFFSTCRISSEIGLDVADTLCFQLGGARRSMTWRQFILALGLHTAEEMAEDGFEAYWLGSERVIPDKWDLSGGRNLKSDDGLRGLSIVTRELPLIDMGELVKLYICIEIRDDWAWVAQCVERQPVAAAAAPGGAKDVSDIDEGAQAVLAPIHAPLPPAPAAGRTMP
ncbi:hypothetical protein Tco_1464074, partial [Tanacetum coccineum]